MRIYLAGPDVFEPDAVAIGEKKKQICEKYGHEGVFPLDNVIEDFSLTRETGLRIGVANEALMDSCDVILANMTPWHGPGMDTGTAYEMGYMRAQGKPVLGYTEDLRPFSQRVIESFGDDAVTWTDDGPKDPYGKTIESFGDLTDNLMMANAVEATGHKVAGSFEEALAQLA